MTYGVAVSDITRSDRILADIEILVGVLVKYKGFADRFAYYQKRT